MSLLSRLAKPLPPVRRTLERVDRLREQRDKIREERDRLRKVVKDERAKSELRLAEVHRLRALAFGHPRREQSDLGYVFIVAVGRSGSTLLQGILSSTPGWMIRGENGGVLHQLYEFHAEACKRRDRFPQDALPSTHPWWGIDGYPETLALDEMRGLFLDTILRPEIGTRVVGFKEVRWNVKDLPAYLHWIREVFPGARFVFNTRDIEKQSKSKWWAERPDAAEEITRMERKLRAAVGEMGDAAYHVHYDDYVADPTTLRGLFEWLGEPFNEKRIRDVMAQPHSY